MGIPAAGAVGPRRDLTHSLLAVLIIGGLIAACLWILQPFFAALVWATMIVVATWPLLLAVQRRLWGRRSLAVAAMTAVLLVMLVLPFWFAAAAIADKSEAITTWTESLSTAVVPPPPPWVESLPIVGARAALAWRQAAATEPQEWVRRAQPHVQQVLKRILAEVRNFGLLVVQLLLTVVVAAILFASGESTVAGARRFSRRLAGMRGEHVLQLSGQAIRAVALGVVLTALLQSALGGIGLWAAGVPFAVVLTAVMFVSAIAQIGAVPVLLCGIVWLYWNGETGAATGLLVWSVIVGSMDNVLRPVLIRRGADLPLVLIFAGVIGGLLAFGLVGIFVGPVVLAVSYTLLVAWVGEGDEEATPEAEPEPEPQPASLPTSTAWPGRAVSGSVDRPQALHGPQKRSTSEKNV